MDKKGSVLMISLWILVMLVVFALGLGQRASINLRLARYQRDRLRAVCLARAGISRAIVALEKDVKDNACDSLKEAWSTGKDSTGKIIFENAKIKEGYDETFTVGHRDSEDKYVCMKDEERKININIASAPVLAALLKESQDYKFDDLQADEIAHDILVWRGDTGIDEDNEKYKNFKKASFSNPQELIIILEYFFQDKDPEDYQNKAQAVFNAIKDLITVWPEEGTNINTADPETLEILVNVSYNELSKRGVEVENPGGLLKSILDYRQNGIFTDTSLEPILTDLSSLQQNIITDSIDGLKNKICVQSDYFQIISEGNIHELKRKAVCVYDRNKGKFVYWHEN